MNNQITFHAKRSLIGHVLVIVFLLSFSANPIEAQVSNYQFTQSLTNYIPINGIIIDSVNEDDVFHPNIAIGFNFNYNGNITNKIGICTNGYVVMDSLNHSALWSPSASTINQINVMMADLKNTNLNGSIQYQTSGTAPNRIFTIQWKNYGLSGNPNAIINAQIHFYETSNCIKMLYGLNTVSGNAGKQFSVGLIGNNILDYYLLRSNLNWLNTTKSTSYPGSGLFLNPLVELPNGLAYNFRACAVLGTPYYYIRGKVFKDVNNNGIQDGGELGMPNITVYDSINTEYSITDLNGDYAIPFHDSNTFYRIKVANPAYWSISSTPKAFTLYPDTQSVNNRNFGLYAMPYVYDIRIHATPFNAPAPNQAVTISAIYQNAGTALLPSDSIVFIKDPRYSFVSANLMPDKIQGDTLKWAYTNLQINEYRQLLVTLLTDNSVLPNQTLYSKWVAYPIQADTLQENNVCFINQMINTSLSPNGKSVSPNGLTLFNQEMVYTIRFQNTSNGYVPENIVIRDTLNNNLDLTSFHLIGATHPVTFTLSGNGILTFKFQNINLPDSSVNEPASHGAVSFAIKPKAGLAVNTQIPNRAGIYFDFLPGITTNTTQNTIVLQWPNSINPITPSQFGLVYPNPCGDQFTLQLFSNQGPMHARIVNAIGATLMEKTLQGEGLHHFNTAQWAQGMYYLILSNPRSKQVISFIHE